MATKDRAKLENTAEFDGLWHFARRNEAEHRDEGISRDGRITIQALAEHLRVRLSDKTVELPADIC